MTTQSGFTQRQHNESRVVAVLDFLQTQPPIPKVIEDTSYKWVVEGTTIIEGVTHLKSNLEYWYKLRSDRALLCYHLIYKETGYHRNTEFKIRLRTVENCKKEFVQNMICPETNKKARDDNHVFEDAENFLDEKPTP